MKPSVASARIGKRALAAGIFLALLLPGVAAAGGSEAVASAGRQVEAFDLGGGATLAVRRGSVSAGARIEVRRPRRRARRLGRGARAVGRPVRVKVRGGRLRKRARVTFRIPGRRALWVAGSPRYRVVRYRPRLKRWARVPTRLNSKRRTASASFIGSPVLSLVIANAVRANADKLAGWILGATGLRGPAADCGTRGAPPAWIDLSTSNFGDDALRSCGGSEGDTAVVEMVNNRPYGILLDYGAPVEWGWADGGFGLREAVFDGRPLEDLLGEDGLYVPPTRRASVGIPKGDWSKATFTARRTYPTLTLDLIEGLLGSGASYRALRAIEGECASELAAAAFGVDGSPGDAAELAAALRSILPAVLACAPALAEALELSNARVQALQAGRKFATTPLLVGRVVGTLVDHTGFFDGRNSFTARNKAPATPDSKPAPTAPMTGDPAPKTPKEPSTPPKTSPSKSVSLSKGASAQGRPGCSSSYCRFMVVKFANFSSGSHTIRCRASHGDEGGFYSYTRSGSSNTSAICYYGFPGRTAWVTVDGVSSNKISW